MTTSRLLGDDSEPARCDLAIEVVWTHGGVDKLDIYRKLGVGEVWIWKSNRLSLHRLRGDRYEPLDASEVLPGIDLQQLLEFLQVRPMTRTEVQGREAVPSRLRDQLRPVASLGHRRASSDRSQGRRD